MQGGLRKRPPWWNCWFVIEKDGEIRVLHWNSLRSRMISDGWKIIDWFRAVTESVARQKAGLLE